MTYTQSQIHRVKDSHNLYPCYSLNTFVLWKTFCTVCATIVLSLKRVLDVYYWKYSQHSCNSFVRLINQGLSVCQYVMQSICPHLLSHQVIEICCKDCCKACLPPVKGIVQNFGKYIYTDGRMDTLLFVKKQLLPLKPQTFIFTLS